MQWVKYGVVITHPSFLKNFLLPGGFVLTLSLVLSERTIASSFFAPSFSLSIFREKKKRFVTFL